MGNDFGITKKNEAIPSKALKGYNRCSLRRERDIYVKEGKRIGNVYEKAVLIKAEWDRRVNMEDPKWDSLPHAHNFNAAEECILRLH